MRHLISILTIIAFGAIKTSGQVKPCQDNWKVNEKGDSVSFYFAEKDPFLREGIEPYFKWIKNNMDKKLVSKKKEEKKKVYVSFTVNEDGSTSDFKIVKGLGDPFDKEAIRLTKDNPQNWVAGECGQKKVRVRMTMTVAF